MLPSNSSSSSNDNYVAYSIPLVKYDSLVGADSRIKVNFPNRAPLHINYITLVAERQERRLYGDINSDVRYIEKFDHKPQIYYDRVLTTAFTMDMFLDFHALAIKDDTDKHQYGLNRKTVERKIDELEFHSVQFNIANNITAFTSKTRYRHRFKEIIESLEVKSMTFTNCIVTGKNLKLLLKTNCKTLTSLTLIEHYLTLKDKQTLIKGLSKNFWITTVTVIDYVYVASRKNNRTREDFGSIFNIKNDNNRSMTIHGIHQIYDLEILSRNDRYYFDENIQWEQELNVKLKSLFLRNKGYQVAHDSTLQFLLVARHKESVLLNYIDKNIIVKMAKLLYGTRNDEEWISSLL